MVEYVDGSVLANSGRPYMRTPIAYALAWPTGGDACERLDLTGSGGSTSKRLTERFPALGCTCWLAAGGARPAILTPPMKSRWQRSSRVASTFLNCRNRCRYVARYDRPPRNASMRYWLSTRSPAVAGERVKDCVV